MVTCVPVLSRIVVSQRLRRAEEEEEEEEEEEKEAKETEPGVAAYHVDEDQYRQTLQFHPCHSHCPEPHRLPRKDGGSLGLTAQFVAHKVNFQGQPNHGASPVQREHDQWKKAYR